MSARHFAKHKNLGYNLFEDMHCRPHALALGNKFHVMLTFVDGNVIGAKIYCDSMNSTD